mmetsp:Transcript_2271/g.3191  ORF Transcript_2271/g.3191 Transcript_2271/m.3191 type:complete len:127 (-) Transcript_2271:590-970(-)
MTSPRTLSSFPFSLKKKTKLKTLSGLQKKVISLYRMMLRTSLEKDRSALGGNQLSPSHGSLEENNTTLFNFMQKQDSTTFHARTKFRESAKRMNVREYDRIEHGIRTGEKYLKLLNMDGTKGIGGS